MAQRHLRVLLEIRLRWSREIVSPEPSMQRLSLWIPATDTNRAHLGDAVVRGNRLFGRDTHWIEERQA